MVLVSPNIVLLIFIIIIIVSALIAWWMKNYANYDKGAFHTFISILTGFGILLVLLFYYNVIVIQAQQQELASIQEISRVNNNVLNGILDGIKNASTIIPNFVLSITPLTNTICVSSAPPDPVTPQTCTEKMVLSYRIFSLWNDVIVSNNFIGICPVAFISNFLQRANSTQLYDEWQVNRLNFITSTQQFGDLLFDYGLQITNQTADEYTSAAQKLIVDPRYIKIFK